MLKGLYFKLHDDHPEENKIIEFFDQESKKLNISKIELLKICISCYVIPKEVKMITAKLDKGQMKVDIQGDSETIIREFSGIIKAMTRQPILLQPAIAALDDMIANIDDDIEQLKKEMKEND